MPSRRCPHIALTPPHPTLSLSSQRCPHATAVTLPSHYLHATSPCSHATAPTPSHCPPDALKPSPLHPHTALSMPSHCHPYVLTLPSRRHPYTVILPSWVAFRATQLLPCITTLRPLQGRDEPLYRNANSKTKKVPYPPPNFTGLISAVSPCPSQKSPSYGEYGKEGG